VTCHSLGNVEALGARISKDISIEQLQLLVSFLDAQTAHQLGSYSSREFEPLLELGATSASS
jgi:hypothetical protein